jgi:putative N6-adenine-specific DNA methylase
MQVFSTPSRIIVTCNRGLAPGVQRELTELGYEPTGAFNTGVELIGTMNDCIRMNLTLRCASQVMYSLRRFRCEDPDELYRVITAIPWETLIASGGYFTVNSNVVHPTIRSGMFANVKVKDAIVDRMRNTTGERPDSGPELRGTVVYLFWRNEDAEIFIDTSGETLAKHGYRKIPGKAPMVEALAAGTILATRWDRQVPLVNPMCGSGTLAIEAALIATHRYPGLLRNRYAFMHVLGFDRNVYRVERERLDQEKSTASGLRIIATDISPEAIQISRTNAEAADVAELIEFSVCDFRETEMPAGGGVLMFNPEYGERLGEEAELIETYSQIGDFMKKKCGGYWGYVFTGNRELGKKIGLKPKRRIEFVTAQLDCRLLEFELYAGTRREKPEVDTSGTSIETESPDQP